MIRSMTGFGRGDSLEGRYRVSVEIKAINHRYADITIKMPKLLNQFDSALRTTVKSYIERGKLDIYVSFEDTALGASNLTYNKSLAEEYLKYLRQMSEDFELDFDIRTSHLSRYQDVIVMKEADAEDPDIYEILDKTLKTALEELVHAREREGEELKNDILEKLDAMNGYASELESRSGSIIDEYKNRIRERLAELSDMHNVDDTRLATEVTLYADKICIDEEIVRLKSHIAGMRDILLKGSAAGRKLDFIAQEMNREANTILSKSSDLEVTNIGISLKTDIEKIREQVQNIE